jgi:hypothetical protein
VAAVFAASTADGHNCHALCETLASSDQRVSPTRFHNSLHNTPAGYWSIATGAMAASQSLAAYDASFAAGLLEALVQIHATAAPCVLIAYDAEYPEPIASLRPIPDAAGIGLAPAPRPGPAAWRAWTSASVTAPPPAGDALPGSPAHRHPGPARPAPAAGPGLGQRRRACLEYLAPSASTST